MSMSTAIQQSNAPSTQGQGSGTEFKERGIKAALTVSLKIAAKPSLSMFRYWHIDLNSGCGFNEKANCFGSPVAFIDAAQENGREDYAAFFVDMDGGAIQKLEKNVLKDNARCFSFIGDNKEALPIIAQYIKNSGDNPQYAHGSILVDPNGYFGKETPHEQLIEFSKEFPRIDIILNLNTRQHTLFSANIRKERKGWTKEKFNPSLSEIPMIFNKSYWLIRGEIGSGDKFVLMVGRNIKAGDHKALGFCHLDSETGQRIVNKVEGIHHVEQQLSFL